MGRFERSYTIPSPYAVATAIPVALGTIRDLMVNDLGWTLEFDNSSTVALGNANTVYMNAARLYTSATFATIISQVVVKSPCGRFRLLFFWSTTSANNGLACVWRRTNDPTTESAAITSVCNNGSSYSELAAGISTILRVDTFGRTFNLQKSHKTAAGVVTVQGAIQYQFDLIKNAPSAPDASSMAFTTAATSVNQIALSVHYISVAGQANEAHATIAFLTDPISTTPAWSVMPFEFIAIPAIIYNMPIYSLRGWVYAYINKPDIAAASVIQIEDSTFVSYSSTLTTRQYFEIDDYIPADLQ